MPVCELLAIQPATQSPQVPNWGQISTAQSPSAITVGGSPFTYQNQTGGPATVIVNGGTVTTIQVSRDGSTFFTVGLLAGMYHLSSGDSIKVTYVIVPTMTLIPF